MKTVFGFVGVLITLFMLISCGTHGKLHKEITGTFMDSLCFEQGFAGLALYDPVEKRMLYTHNADKYFTPASNTKLLTFYTGLSILGDSVPALKYHVSGDSLIFSGTGDPSLLNTDLPSSNILDFLRYRRECLFYEVPSYTETHFGPGWAWDDYDYYYSVERAAYPIYANRATFTQNDSQEVPEAYPKYYKKNLVLDSLNLQKTSRLSRKLNENTVFYQNMVRDTSFRQEVPLKYSPELFVEVLEDTLKKEVGLISKYRPFNGIEKTLYSIPTDSLYKQMLMVSDNFLAEQILLLAAGVLTDTLKTGIAIDYMKENAFKQLPDKPIWVDGSGLSRYNLQTPRNMIKVLELITEKMPVEKVIQFLPVSGKEGSLENYSGAIPYLYAKTGSMSNNHSLSGFIKTKSGKMLLFSFMNSNYIVPSATLKEGMEKILLKIRDHY
ncbi:D-alanyl-D-alanine carboxypeptidase [Flavimarina sp. Hel_I_48]|uniref:D-alanyl-D-alanine carboxypeptidase n=1 Tax=Flavimarina sp. Hel_I_48 TaxID=1392488 RepID=UPI0004DEF1E1|nr:D-alanyl-D-alanine carboxypeptidase [Flavimarina sp. Hel_I_48]